MGDKGKTLKFKFLAFFVVIVLIDCVYIGYYYSTFLSGPPVTVGVLQFLPSISFKNNTMATNKWMKLFCMTAQAKTIYLDIYVDGLFIKPIVWTILNNTRLYVLNSPSDYLKYNYKEFPYLNITYIRFELVIDTGLSSTRVVAINYTAPIYKFHENNTEFPIYYSKKPGPYQFKTWIISVYLAFLDDTRENVTFSGNSYIDIVLLFGLYQKRTVEMANLFFKKYILPSYV
ncbi:MAG: hypothetical protein ACP6IS_08340 [Candidatus Asgardarchaeia archaeon]